MVDVPYVSLLEASCFLTFPLCVEDLWSSFLEMCRNQSGKQLSNPNSPVWSWTLPKKNRNKLVELGILVWFTALDEEWMDLSKPPPRYQATGIAAAQWASPGVTLDDSNVNFHPEMMGLVRETTPKSGLLILFQVWSHHDLPNPAR